jgi:hypothetical protein
VASGWHNKVARLSRTDWDWDELRTRVAQQLQKRSDLLRYRLGMHPAAIQLRESTAPAGKFFFTGSQAAERAELLRQHLPEQASEIVREADEICEHRFCLLGYENLDYGREIDWHLDRVHDKRAPLEPWCKVPFLEFAAVGDHKVTWELNRHQHLVTLAKAWLLTNDEKYVRELMTQWRSWLKSNPYPVGINWGSSLEVAFRSLSWIWVDQLLAANAGRGRPALHAPQYAEFRAELLPALAFHGCYIERYLSTYFSPNTHLLGEVLALFFLGTLYPQVPGAARWKNEGWRVLLYEAGRQVRPDGVYFEQSLYYHVYALDFFIYARMLASANDLSIPADYDAILVRMLNVVQSLAQAGPAEGFGDDDGGRLFNARRNCTEHMTDPLALGAVVYHYDRDDLAAAQLTEESIWLFGERAVTRLAPTRRKAQDNACSVAFPDGGLYILAGGRTDTSSGVPDAVPVGSQPYAHAMVIDAGPQGEGRCGHGHADALSLRLTMNGSRWLVDSGSGVYISAGPAERNAFRGTAAHNTIRVDGMDQAVAGEPFSWTHIPTTHVEDWVIGRAFTYFAARHNGYERLADPVTHRRCVLHLNDGIWLVRDLVLGSAEHDLELRWHFASDVSVREAGAGEFVASRPEAPEHLALRMIMPRTIPEDNCWKTQITRGLGSPAYGLYQPAPEIRSETRVKLPTEIATALIAQRRPGQTQGEAHMVSRHEATVQVYELHEGNQSHEFFFPHNHAHDNQSWSSGPWSTNADLLYCRVEEEKLVQLIVVGGNLVAWQGRPLLNARRPCQFFEWRKCDGVTHSEPEPVSTTPLFDELTGGSQPCSNSFNAISSYAEKH